MMSKIIALFFAALIAFGLSLLIIPSIGILLGVLFPKSMQKKAAEENAKK
jgi:hypothetical protein